ncbi:hypothetical protein LP316_02980 [Thalassotalea sp. LPB0316]|uniref:hypothetical protein n=1 Tax=Thalassotalea sp. LPB0316 TaxID=2769490 RepID=UPI001866DE4C|nr:hypothetical protein [Thalassotalea sp. LPB0316]QOL26284.1 hypothetical protein LP316_02980 [Thalassotalea sp. LPB0316]
MFLIIGITAILFLISIYLFYRAEHFKKEISAYKREAKMTKQENLSIANSMVLAGTRHQDMLKRRLSQLQDKVSDDEKMKHELLVISYLLSQYSNVYRELLKGEQTVSQLYSKFLGDTGKRYFSDIDEHVRESDAKIRQMWASKDLCVFISFIELQLEIQTKQMQNQKTKEIA